MKVAIQTGLRLASRVPIEVEAPTAYQIKAKPIPHEFEFSNGGSLLVCNPGGFSSVRELAGLDHNAFFASLTQDELLGGGTEESGKSGSIFWYSKDGRFVLKSVAEEELQNLLAILPKYAKHLMEHRDSLLTRYFGAYRITPVRGGDVVNIVVMNNVLEGAKCHKLYDLKGTTEDRLVEELDGKCLKDRNFERVTMYASAEVNNKLHGVLQSDARFLERLRIMDYSLILSIQYISKDQRIALHLTPWSELMGGVEGTTCSENSDGTVEEACVFHIGVVDMLTTYDFKKQVAHALKSNTIAHFCGEIDTVPPDVYADRFCSYFKRKFLAETKAVKVSHQQRAAPVDLLSFDTFAKPAAARSATQSCAVADLLDLSFTSHANSMPGVSSREPVRAIGAMQMNFDPLCAATGAPKACAAEVAHDPNSLSFDLLGLS